MAITAKSVENTLFTLGGKQAWLECFAQHTDTECQDDTVQKMKSKDIASEVQMESDC